MALVVLLQSAFVFYTQSKAFELNVCIYTYTTNFPSMQWTPNVWHHFPSCSHVILNEKYIFVVCLCVILC